MLKARNPLLLRLKSGQAARAFASSTQNNSMPEGHYVEDGRTYISQPLGRIQMRKRSLNYEEVLEIDVSKETLVEAESRMKQSLSQFIDVPQTPAKAKKKANKKSQPQLSLESIMAQIEPVQAQQPQEKAKATAAVTPAYLEAELAFARLQELKAMFGEEAPSLRHVNFESLVLSSALRGKILDYTKMHY
jgi:hypothetical protein